jgi:hypothetical protein
MFKADARLAAEKSSPALETSSGGGEELDVVIGGSLIVPARRVGVCWTAELKKGGSA